MDLKQWDKEETKRSWEYVDKTSMKFLKKGNVDIFEDLVPELVDLSGRSYAVLKEGGTPAICESFPEYSLGLLLRSGFYENIIVPIRALPDKTTFEIHYGLSESAGCGISYEQFLTLIEDGSVRISLCHSPEDFSAKFYEEIFKSCDKLPPHTGIRIAGLVNNLKLMQMASLEKISPSKSWRQKTLKLHPELDIAEIREKEVKKIFGDYVRNPPANQFLPGKDDYTRELSTLLWVLRSFGLQRLADLGLKCASLDQKFGHFVLKGWHEYLLSPITQSTFAFNNYVLENIQIMLFLKVLPRSLGSVYKEILSSSPASSSAVSHQISVDSVELKGMELLKLIEDFADNKNVKDLRENIVDVNMALGKFDPSIAERSFNKVEQIILESINSEMRSYSRKARVTSHSVRLGKTLTAMTKDGFKLLAGLMAGFGKFEWAIAALTGAGVSTWIREKLNEIKEEDIVKWWSMNWPFEDPGIGFVIWEKSQKRKQRDIIHD